MLRYDLHQHLWPPELIHALRRRNAPPLLSGSELVTPEGAFRFDPRQHEPERRLAVLARDELDVAVVSLQPSLGIETLPTAERDELESAWLEGIGGLVAGSSGRFVALAPWRVVSGFAGTSVGASALLSEHGADVLAEVDAVAGLLFVHPEAGGPLPPGRPDWWQWTAGYAGQMQEAYLAWLGGLRAHYPRIRVVFAMLAGGGPLQHERLVHRGVHVREAADQDTLFDTSSYGRRAIELCIETFGIERLVYGSDVPVIDPAPTLRAVRALGASVARFLQSDNPARLVSETIDPRRSLEP
ncbi:MAG: amidohydrolase family protein [Gaiellales bacterium]